MRQLNRLLITSILTLLLTACSSEPVYRGMGGGGTGDLNQLVDLTADPSGISAVTGQDAIRHQALQETALSIGAQSALAWRSVRINQTLKGHDAELQRVFNFNALLLNDNVLPPVLEEGRDTLKLDDDNTIRLADRTYRIISQARFVTTPPTWHDYISMNFSQPPRPDNTLLPLNADERKVWKKYVEIGWNEGIQQANNMFNENLARLKRDYKGMALYRALLAQHMVSEPYVAKANLGITGSGEDMRINDQVLRITALPTLQTNSREWKPAMTAEPRPKQREVITNRYSGGGYEK